MEVCVPYSAEMAAAENEYHSRGLITIVVCERPRGDGWEFPGATSTLISSCQIDSCCTCLRQVSATKSSTTTLDLSWVKPRLNSSHGRG
jgi:hypothetical protein